MIDKAARELGIDRVADPQDQRAGLDRARSAPDRGPVTSAFIKEALDKGATHVQLGREEEALRPEERQQGDRHRRRPGLPFGRLERLRRPAAHHAGRQAARPHRRRQSRHLLAFGDGAGCGGTAELRRGTTSIIERGDSRRGLPWNSPQAGSLTASTESRTKYVAAMDMKEKLLDIAAQMLGGTPDDYDLGDERVVSKADASKSITYAQAAQKAIELGGKYSGKEVPADINPVTKDGVGDDRRHRSDRRRQGQPAARRRDAGPDGELRRDRTRHRDRQVQDQGTCCASPTAAPSCIRRGSAHQIRGGNVMGIGLAHLERHVYDPKLGIPTTVLLYQAKPPAYLDVPAEMRLGSGGKARSAEPDRRERRGRTAAGLGRGRDHLRDLGRASAGTCSIARPCRPT